MDLGIDDDELASCVACGLCLPHCPTYRVTGEEALSPRGRVAAMRQVQWDGVAVDDSFVRSMETCVQCRGCETACPSGVPFGHLIEPTRATLAEGRSDPDPVQVASGNGGRLHRVAAARPPLVLRVAMRTLRWHRLVLAGSSALAVAQRLHLVPPRLARRLGLPARMPIRRPRLTPSATGADPRRDVWLFTGCVMDAWMRDVHADVQRVVEAAGGRVALPGADASCCGALAQHAGLASEARAFARRTMRAFPGEGPILVDSAGCGAMLRDYGHLLGTDDAAEFSARVHDVHEWLAPRVDRLVAAADAASVDATDRTAARPGVGRHRPDPPSDAPSGTAGDTGSTDRRRTARPTVAVQDPCHLRHVQRAHDAVRTVLAPFATLAELDDEGLCCGAGGAYAAVQPELAGAIRDRKLAAIDRSGAPVVVSANPGCALHLAAAGVEVVHPCQIVARTLDVTDR